MAIANTTGRVRRPKPTRTTNTANDFYGIIKELPGRKWHVEYFNKIVGKQESINPYDSKEQGYLKNFNRIVNMPLAVDTEIPTIGNVEDLKGEALVNVGVVPTRGDMFIAYLTNETMALFDVYDVKLLTYNGNNIYKLSYRVKEYIDSEEKLTEEREGLESGIVDDLIYDPSSIKHNTKPILEVEEYDLLEKMMSLEVRMKREWVSNIQRHSHLLAPKFQDDFILDEDNKVFINKILGAKIGHSFGLYNFLTTNEKSYTIYDVIQNPDTLPYISMYNIFGDTTARAKNVTTRALLLSNKYTLFKSSEKVDKAFDATLTSSVNTDGINIDDATIIDDESPNDDLNYDTEYRRIGNFATFGVSLINKPKITFGKINYEVSSKPNGYDNFDDVFIPGVDTITEPDPAPVDDSVDNSDPVDDPAPVDDSVDDSDPVDDNPSEAEPVVVLEDYQVSPSSSSIPPLYGATYIFGESFYETLGIADIDEEIPPMSLLEQVTLKFIRHQENDIRDIIKLLNDMRLFTYNELIYFGPIILFIASRSDGRSVRTF